MTTDRQCPSCGGFCKKSGCERENVQPEQRSEQWWKHEVSNAFAQGYEKGRLQRQWNELTDEQIQQIEMSASSKLSAIYLTEAQLKGKNT